MEMSGQSQTQTALPLRKEPLLLIESEWLVPTAGLDVFDAGYNLLSLAGFESRMVSSTI